MEWSNARNSVMFVMLECLNVSCAQIPDLEHFVKHQARCARGATAGAWTAADARAPSARHRTRNPQGWPKFWADFRPLIGILSQNVGQLARFGSTRCISGHRANGGSDISFFLMKPIQRVPRYQVCRGCAHTSLSTLLPAHTHSRPIRRRSLPCLTSASTHFQTELHLFFQKR